MWTRAIALGCVLGAAGAAGAGVRTGIRTPGGRTVGMGTVTEDPEKIKQRYRKRCREQIDLARKYMTKGEWGEARLTLDTAARLAIDMSLAKEVQTLRIQIDAEGRRRLTDADSAYRQSRYVEALRAYERIVREFGPLPSAIAARDALTLAEADPAVKGALQEAKAQVLGDIVEKMITRFFTPRAAATQPASRPADRVDCIKALKVPQQKRAFALLVQMEKLYGRSPTGKRAAADLKRLRSDKAFQAAMSRCEAVDKAEKALKRAQLYEKNDMLRKALEYYREVVTKFPETEEARKAKTMVTVLEARLGVR